jgi:hypothetical protein
MKQYFKHKYHWVKHHKNHWVRKSVAALLIVGGLLGFLPVLGFWMLPLGLMLLATDMASVRRFNRRVYVWWGRRFGNAGERGGKPRR